MSRAIASARQRRAGVSPSEPIQSNQPKLNPNSNPQNGLTIHQVIALIDTRLVKLEKFASDNKIGEVSKNVRFLPDASPSVAAEPSSNVSEMLDDFNNRFVLLAEEISNLKDIVMKLQTYTMDVNKTLLEERIQILSDLGNDDGSLYIMGNDTNAQTMEVENIEDELSTKSTD